MSNLSSTRQFADGITITNWLPKPKAAEDTTNAQIVEKPKKKKNRGGKKAKRSKVELSISNDNTQAAAATATAASASNTTAEPASAPLSKKAKKKLRAQPKADKAAKAARAVQIAAAAKATKMGVSVSIDETTTTSDDASFSTSEDTCAPVTASPSSDAPDTVDAPEPSSGTTDASLSGDVGVSSSTEACEEPLAASEDASSTATASSSHSGAVDATHTPESPSVVEDAASASGDVNEAPKSMPLDTSEDVAIGFGNNATFDFGHSSSFETVDAAFSGVPEPININDVLSKFGRAFSPSLPPIGAVVTAPLAPKVRKATSFANAVRKHHETQETPSILNGSKPPRGMVPVKLNRKPLTEASKKDHQVSNPLFQTLIKKSSTDSICAEAVHNLQANFGATLPRKPVKKVSKPLKIDYYPPVDGASASNAVESDDIVDVDMVDAVSFTGAEDIADETVAATTPEAEDASEGVNTIEPVIDSAVSAPALADQVNEAISEDTESSHSKDEQQGKHEATHELLSHTDNVFKDEPAVQDTTKSAEQTSKIDLAEVIIDETAALSPSPDLLKTPEPMEEVVVDTPQVCDHPAVTAFKSALDFLALPNAAMYPPVLSRDAEQAVISMHVTPLHLQELPGTVKKMPRAEKTAAKSSKSSPVDDAPSAAVLKSELAFLSFPNAAEYPPSLSREAELFLIDSHVTPLHLQKAPGAAEKPTAASEKATKKAEKKAAARQATMSSPDAPEESVTPTPSDEDTFVTDLLAMPNGPGQALEARQFEEKMVALHVAPLVSSQPSTRYRKSKAEKKAEKDALKSACEALADAPVEGIEIGGAPDIGADAFAELAPAATEDKAMDSDANTEVEEVAPTVKTSSHLSSSSPSTQERVAIEMSHSFLGITRLTRFLAALSMSPDYTVTKDALCATFRSFATAECRILLGRVPAYMGGELDNVGVQCKIMLGDTSLYEFMQAVQWTDDESTMEEVVRVFNEKAVEGETFDAQMQPIVNRIAMG